MTTRYVLVPGAASDSWYWHRVVPLLEARGHEVVAVDLPCDDPDAGLQAYADVVARAAGDHPAVVVVAQSMGALAATLACARRPVDLLVLVAPLVPRAGETGGQWWEAVGQADAAATLAAREGRDPGSSDPVEIYLHDVPDEIVAASAAHVLDQSGRPFEDPWPLERWPDVPTRVVACREDRLLPLELVRRYTLDRLGIAPDEMSGGHLPALAHPQELVDVLEWVRWQEAPGRRQGRRLGSQQTSVETVEEARR